MLKVNKCWHHFFFFRNFSEIFRNNVTYDSIESYKKLGVQPLSRKHNFGKNTGRSNWSPTFLGLKQQLDLCKVYVSEKRINSNKSNNKGKKKMIYRRGDISQRSILVNLTAHSFLNWCWSLRFYIFHLKVIRSLIPNWHP